MKKSLLLALCLVPTLAIADDGENCRTMTTVPADEMTLWDVIELGLCRNPETASAYLSLESARFNKNAGYSQYLPSISASASASYAFDAIQTNMGVSRSYNKHGNSQTSFSGSVSGSVLGTSETGPLFTRESSDTVGIVSILL